MKPLVAIVGRPNVGKSTLFNKISGRRISIVEDTPGVTRDRIYADASWLDKHFTLIDTGGIEPKTKDEILVQMRRQANLAIEMADVVVLVTNVADGVTANDYDVASMLLKAKKNEVELQMMREVYLKDSLVVCRFMKWLKENIGKIA